MIALKQTSITNELRIIRPFKASAWEDFGKTTGFQNDHLEAKK